MRLDFTSWALGAGRHRGINTEHREHLKGEEPLIGLTDHGEQVLWPAPSLDRAASVVCFGASGSGKSALIGNAIAHEIARGRGALPPHLQPAALIIIPKSDFRVIFEQVLAAEAPDALINLVCLDPFSPTGFPFNLCRLPLNGTPVEIRAWQLSVLVGEISTSTGTLRSGSAGIGAKQVDVLNHLLLAALTVDDPRTNVLLAYDALTTPRGFARLASLTRSERAQAFLLENKLGDDLVASVGARLRLAFAATESLERMVGCDDCISFDTLTAAGMLCLYDFGKPFGGMPGLQSFWASLLAALTIDHALARPSPFVDGHHLRIVIDELQIVAPVLASRAEALLTTGRSRNLSTVQISQGTALIHRAADTLISTLLTNCPTKIVGRLAAADAELLSKDQTPIPGNNERPKNLRERFAAAVCNLPDRRFYCLEPSRRRLFTSTPLDVARWELAAEREEAAIAAAAHRFALPASTPPRTTLAALTPEFDTATHRGRRVGQGFTSSNDDETSRSGPEHQPATSRSRWG